MHFSTTANKVLHRHGESARRYKYLVDQKQQDTIFVPTTLPNVDRFAEFFRPADSAEKCSEVNQSINLGLIDG